jgi:hypothetical protein
MDSDRCASLAGFDVADMTSEYRIHGNKQSGAA